MSEDLEKDNTNQTEKKAEPPLEQQITPEDAKLTPLKAIGGLVSLAIMGLGFYLWYQNMSSGSTIYFIGLFLFFLVFIGKLALVSNKHYYNTAEQLPSELRKPFLIYYYIGAPLVLGYGYMLFFNPPNAPPEKSFVEQQRELNAEIAALEGQLNSLVGRGNQNNQLNQVMADLESDLQNLEQNAERMVDSANEMLDTLVAEISKQFDSITEVEKRELITMLMEDDPNSLSLSVLAEFIKKEQDPELLTYYLESTNEYLDEDIEIDQSDLEKSREVALEKLRTAIKRYEL